MKIEIRKVCNGWIVKTNIRNDVGDERVFKAAEELNEFIAKYCLDAERTSGKTIGGPYVLKSDIHPVV